MLNQFYNYLSNKIIDYFYEIEVKPGERYYLQLDESHQVEAFYNTLKKHSISEPFVYQHFKGDSYSTFALRIGNTPVVVVYTGNVTSGYLVTLRNKVSDQEKDWEGTALFIICDNAVDSIYGGMADLQRKGMPLNSRSIIKNLQNDIESSSLSKVDKEVAKFYLNKKDEDTFQSTLWDYQEVLAIVYKGEINKNDYKSLGLFYDNYLGDYTHSKQIKNRLNENFELFQKVNHFNEYDDKKEQLEKIFDEKGTKLLNTDEWYNTYFSDVKNSHERLKGADAPLNYLESQSKQTDNSLVYWEKPKEYTKSGERKRHIIIFNPNHASEVSITFEFNQKLLKDSLNSNCSSFAKVSGKKLIVNFSINKEITTYKKITYKHKNQMQSQYEFNICVIPFEQSIIESIKSNYIIDNKNKRITVITNSEDSTFIFGKTNKIEMINIEQNNQDVTIDENKSIKIAEDCPGWDEGSIIFNLNYRNFSVPIEIKEENKKAYPVKSVVIWKYKREKKENFIFSGSKVTQDVNSFYLDEKFKEYLVLEQTIIDNDIKYGKKIFNTIEPLDITLSCDLESCYLKIIEYFKKINNIPSLVSLNKELFALYDEYVNVFNREIEEIRENSILSENRDKYQLLKLGTIDFEGKVLFSPLSPLNIAYQLEVYRQCKTEKIDRHILERLNARNLLPYIYKENDILYRSIHQEDAVEWIVYEKSKNVSLGETNEFIANVVKEKMNQFISHFKYLFNNKSNAPIKLNLINVENDKEVLRGVINFIQDRILDNTIIPVDINIYSPSKISSFDYFFSLNTIEKVENEFNVKMKSKNLDALDVLRLIQQNINYSKHSKLNTIDYAHISFFKLGYDAEKTAKDNMNQIDTGLSLNGLVSSVTSVTGRSKYRTGFGTKNILNHNRQLIKTATLLNELAANSDNDCENPYSKNKTIVTKPMEINESLLNELYLKSHWVTFIEPTFGLEYFAQHKNDLLIIHYSEQYSSSDKYDTITVTNKSKQYKQIIKEFLIKREINIQENELDYVIKAFNSINGEWLLNIISSHTEYEREKLSIISAIKYGLAILDHPNIVWIPVSMEEILRISGAVKLNKSEGLFTIKNLKQKGIHSDDLLFIGVEERNDNLKVYFYPIEVKVGYNFANTIEKGKNQIHKTYELLKTQLTNLSEEDSFFRNSFFRNFFIKVLLTNEQKLSINHVWEQKEFEKIEKYKDRLLNDQYEITFDLQPIIGKGSLISFKKENFFKSVRKEGDIYLIELSEEDAYNGIVKTVQQLHNEIQLNQSDIDTNKLLSNAINESYLYENEIQEINRVVNEMHNITIATPDTISPKEKELLVNSEMRILLGEAEGSIHSIYWEYGNKGLANRHILIEGKSGQGKTYFIQCILKELANQGVPSIVIDYTEGFKSSQLELEFKEYMGNRLVQYLVAKDKFPLNPFKRSVKELDEGLYIDEDNIDIAERFKSVIGAVYSDLGAQQLNCIYQSTIKGLEKYDDNMDLPKLREQLLEDSTPQAKTALAQLSLLIDKNPFDSSELFDWEKILTVRGSIFIIQLTGYTRDVQKIITEIILWDLWNHKLQHGTKEKPFAVVLDEAQNLDFNDNSPSTRILTEGRKFGWSAWFATQFLKGKMNKAAISRLQNSAQKIYFSPAEEAISDIANIIGKDDKKYWERKLSELKKGECIVYGPTLNNLGELTPSRPIKIKITNLESRK